MVEQPALEILHGVGRSIVGRQEGSDLVAKLLRTQVVERNSQDCTVLRKQFGFRQVEERRNKFAFGEIAGGAKQDQKAGSSDLASGQLLRTALNRSGRYQSAPL